jgi:hypothetical protein
MPFKVSREGVSSDTSGLSILEFGKLFARRDLVIMTHREPRGFGQSRHEIRIEPDCFAALAQAMMYANPEEAIKAFGRALQSGIPNNTDDLWVAEEISN